MAPPPPKKKRAATAAAASASQAKKGKASSSSRASRRKSHEEYDYSSTEDDDDDVIVQSPKSTTKSKKKPLSAAEQRRRKANETKQQPLAFKKTSKYSVGMKLLLEDSIYGRPGDIPLEVRGHQFEYQVVSIDDSRRCTVKFNDLVIKPSGDKFRAFNESEEEQQMSFPLDNLDDAHELWQKANGRCNSRAFLALEAIRKTQNADVVEGARAELDDIDELFRKKGRGPHMLEMEFDKVTEFPTDYMQRCGNTNTGKTLQKWEWLHRLTPQSKSKPKNPVTRYVVLFIRLFSYIIMQLTLSSSLSFFPGMRTSQERILILVNSPNI
jgi:hypothetical protein